MGRSFFFFPEQVNERAARLVAGVVALTLGLALVLRAEWVVPVVAAGFVLRVAWGPRWSPLARLASYAAPLLARPRLVPGQPKRFAQGVGAALTVAASALLLGGAGVAGWALAGLVVTCATLEAALGWCAGCFLFGLLSRVGLVRAEACERCARAYGEPPARAGAATAR
jgi:hypothetical protein